MMSTVLPRLKKCYLKPGEVLLTTEPSLITTVLGSCLSVTMRHKASGMSIICHAVMPARADAREEIKGNAFLYVDSSLQWMIDRYAEKGIRMRDIEVKMFGGAALFQDPASLQRDASVGQKNIDAATAFLKKHRINLAAWNVGGSRRRKLIFNTETGEVLAKFITKAEISLINCGGKK